MVIPTREQVYHLDYLIQVQVLVKFRDWAFSWAVEETSLSFSWVYGRRTEIKLGLTSCVHDGDFKTFVEIYRNDLPTPRPLEWVGNPLSSVSHFPPVFSSVLWFSFPG